MRGSRSCTSSTNHHRLIRVDRMIDDSVRFHAVDRADPVDQRRSSSPIERGRDDGDQVETAADRMQRAHIRDIVQVLRRPAPAPWRPA